MKKRVNDSCLRGCYMSRVKKKNIVVWILIMVTLLFFVLQAGAVEAAADQQTSNDQSIADGTYKLISGADNGLVWDISNASVEDGANLQLYSDNSSNAQKFVFVYDMEGYYTITNANSGKAIEGAEKDGAANIQQNTSNGSDAQKWKLIPAENGYYVLACKYNGLVADVAGGTAAQGANIQLYQLQNTPAQEFKIVETEKAETQPATKHSKGFFSSITFLLLGIEAIIVIGIGYYFQIVVSKKEAHKEKKKESNNRDS